MTDTFETTGRIGEGGTVVVVATLGERVDANGDRGSIDDAFAALLSDRATGGDAALAVVGAADILATRATGFGFTAYRCCRTGKIGLPAANAGETSGRISRSGALGVAAALTGAQADRHTVSSAAAIGCIAAAASTHPGKCFSSPAEIAAGARRTAGAIVTRRPGSDRRKAGACAALPVAGLLDRAAILLQTEYGREANSAAVAALAIAALPGFAAAFQSAWVTGRRVAAGVLVAAD